MLTLQRINGEVIATGDNFRTMILNHKNNLNHADLRGADLRDANLRGANLCCANLQGASLCGADLSEANLHGAKLCLTNLNFANLQDADLSFADLRSANLCYADLRRANLQMSNLRGTDLNHANLKNIKPNWHSRELIAQMLMNEAGDDVEKRKIAGVILVSKGWCWSTFIRINDPLRNWTIAVLKEYDVSDPYSFVAKYLTQEN